MAPVPFGGNWTSTDTDGSAQTMEIGIAADGSTQMTVHDDAATAACAGAAATVTGTGLLDGIGDLVITLTSLTCADGSEPAVRPENVGTCTLRYDIDADTFTV